jgi:hypothetical protein
MYMPGVAEDDDQGVHRRLRECSRDVGGRGRYRLATVIDDGGVSESRLEGGGE